MPQLGLEHQNNGMRLTPGSGTALALPLAHGTRNPTRKAGDLKSKVSESTTREAMEPITSYRLEALQLNIEKAMPTERPPCSTLAT